ncbi:hypothetical protein PanWU01x14_098990 [Parasponia andersonii]|uniref:Uncharacterized protein n=1 Tax=Parasponia andersonii TaxID=3476 RepID=A0A2P5D4C0_PARAD|nr:hypothetical protein PanWU01x14_098990 [Parasponia andersonii]
MPCNPEWWTHLRRLLPKWIVRKLPTTAAIKI